MSACANSFYPIQPLIKANAAFAIISTLVIGTGSVYDINRVETWRQHVQSRSSFVVDDKSNSYSSVDRVDIRSPSQHIKNIREIIDPAISDLSNLFDVSRQSIYKWLSGNSLPEPDKLDRIHTLSKIADIFKAENVTHSESLLKMKAFNGKSLLDLIKTGENNDKHLSDLINESKVMQQSYLQSGLSSSKAKPTNDWQSSESIPGAIDQI